MAKYEKHEFRITEEFKPKWEQFLYELRRKGLTISEGVRKAIEAYLAPKTEKPISKVNEKFLLQLPFALSARVEKEEDFNKDIDSLLLKMGDEDHCIICGRKSRLIIQTPYGKYGLCEAAWNSICDLEEKDV